jgi:hypothetical protein
MRIIQDLPGTIRAAFVGRSETAVERFASIGPERLLFYQLVMTFLIAVQVSVAGRAEARIFTPATMIVGRSPYGILFMPPVAAALTLLWAFIFALMAGVERRRLPDLFAVFLGSSLFLVPAVIPFIGPDLLVFFLIGWPALLVRFLAAATGKTPGRTALLLLGPPAVLFLVFRLFLLTVGMLAFT